jgi:hypothetical protein
MALFGVGRRAAHGKDAVPGPHLVQPRRSLDGWTLEGTPFAGRFDPEELRELGTLLHGVHAQMRTAWTYERAADLLERAGERPQALAVVDAWFALPEDVRRSSPAATRSLGRRRQRLRGRLGATTATTSTTETTATTPATATAAGTATGATPAAIPTQSRPSVRIPAKPADPPQSGASTTEKATRQ